MLECLSSNILILDWKTDPITLSSHLVYLALHLAWGLRSFPYQTRVMKALSGLILSDGL